MHEKLEARRARTRAGLAGGGSVLCSLGGLAFGLEVGGPAAGLAGLLLPLGTLAVFFAIREPPPVPPVKTE